MNKVVDLLKLPCLKNCFITAGYDGIFNTVKRMDILETSFPVVEKYLKPYEFVFTSFWNLKDDKENRINLVKSMIEHKCAGIGIMPGVNLNNEIDQSIIDLGNKHSFPIMYIPSNVRWSDIISEFSLLSNSIYQSDMDSDFFEILASFGDLHSDKNIKLFCNQLSHFLSLPVIIKADNIYTMGINDKTVSIVLSKVYSIMTQNTYKINTPIPLHINNENLSVVYFGNNSILATYIDRQSINNSKLQIFHKIAPIITKELDSLCGYLPMKSCHKKIDLIKDVSYYLILLRKEQVNLILEFINKTYLIYEFNDFYNYIIFLIPKDENGMNIFNEYNNIIEKTRPLLFIFSNQFFSTNELYTQIEILKKSVHSLLFLDGIFSIDELPFLYMILCSPYEYKKEVFRGGSSSINLEIESSFFDTLRLYLVLKNISDVSALLGIHSNSVKYRISKCFKSSETDLHSVLADVPFLKYLLLLEIMKVEDIII